MVYLTRFLLSKIRKPTRKYFQQGFRDSLRILVCGGTGGNGLPKFGGVGGQGGDVKLVAKDNISLHEVFRSNKSKRYDAKSGKHSSHNFILGPPGENFSIDVPVGVTVISETGKKLGELNEEGEELLVAKGGVGGNPKNSFFGRKGDSNYIILDLKLIADIGLVGFPNAGKSTLLKAISHAKPKIAAYPFTTIRPNIGLIMYRDFRQISMADLPGLIEGAYANKGMGHKFLKHVERTKLLLLIVDINGFQLSPQYPHRDCLETILLLNKELELYNKDLLDKPAMLLINKMDADNAKDKYELIRDKLRNLSEIALDYPEIMQSEKILKFSEIIPISAKESSEDVEKLKNRLRKILDVMDELQKDDIEKNTGLYTEIREKLVERGPKLA